MVKNSRLLIELERSLIKREKHTYAEALKLMESLWEQARSLGVLPLADPLAGIESDIKLARILNRCSNDLS